MRSSSRKRSEKKLDELWSKLIRSKGYCEICGKHVKQPILHAHHIYSRKHKGTRWNLDNGVCLCPRHHLFFAHKDIMEFADWVRQTRPAEILDRLKIYANSVSKFYEGDIDFMVDEYSKKLLQLESTRY